MIVREVHDWLGKMRDEAARCSRITQEVYTGVRDNMGLAASLGDSTKRVLSYWNRYVGETPVRGEACGGSGACCMAASDRHEDAGPERLPRYSDNSNKTKHPGAATNHAPSEQMTKYIRPRKYAVLGNYLLSGSSKCNISVRQPSR
jgi:hypothetical protein